MYNFVWRDCNGYSPVAFGHLLFCQRWHGNGKSWVTLHFWCRDLQKSLIRTSQNLKTSTTFEWITDQAEVFIGDILQWTDEQHLPCARWLTICSAVGAVIDPLHGSYERGTIP